MKLYWRYKKDGEWTWKAAKVTKHAPGAYTIVAAPPTLAGLFAEESE